jgi:hypothetical protein
VDGVFTELLLAKVAYAGADRGIGAATSNHQLGQRVPLAIEHHVSDTAQLCEQPVLVFLWVVGDPAK